MKSLIRLQSFLICLVTAALPLTTRAALDTNRIAQITSLSGAWNAAEGVFKVSAPRSDVQVSVDGWTMPPFMGLTSWAAFTAGKGRSEEHTSELQSLAYLVCRLLLEKKKKTRTA